MARKRKIAVRITHSPEARKLADLIEGIHAAMLTTVTDGGVLRSRPMATQRQPFNGTLWFFTYRNSAKTREIARDRHVNVSFADESSNTYVSVSGMARVVVDKAKAKELWNPMVKAWFPRGLSDPRLALLRVRVDQAEYWDGPSSRMVRLFEYAKALATGSRPDELDENRKVSLTREVSVNRGRPARQRTSPARAARRRTSARKAPRKRR